MIQQYGPRIAIALSAFAFVLALNAQNFTIVESQINSCSGTLFDSGGPLGPGYGVNENFTTTICGDDPEYAVYLTFIGFDLDQSGTDDQLVVYDGNSTSAPLIGTFYGTDLADLTVGASANNSSGCLTLVFTSGSSGTGFFVAEIGCTGTCPTPTAVFTVPESDPVQICSGDVVSVNGSTSSAAPGREIEQWIWDRGLNGIDTTNTPEATFSFDIGGLHRILLHVVDNFGCASAVADSAIVLVSPVPSFSGTTTLTVACEGSPVELTGVATQTPMVGNPQGCSNASNGLPLPDQQLTQSALAVSAGGNATITDLAQLGDICLEIEHTFMSDIVLTVTCPNGSALVLHNRGGGGTWLGDANNSDAEPIIPGACFQYCFGTDPDYGTLAQSVANGITPNVVQTSQGGTAVGPGRYAPVGALEQLLGCPMSGTWTLTSSDLAGGDNGYLCGWCISFGNGPDSSYIDQGPVLGTSADSSFWSAPAVNDPQNPSSATYDPQEGVQALTYSVVDSYGCGYDTTLVVSVGVPPTVSIEELPDLGLVCAETSESGAFQWSYAGEEVEGAAGSCFTPPGSGVIGVTVTTLEGCSGEATYLSTGLAPGQTDAPSMVVYPSPNNGTFSVLTAGVSTRNAHLQVLDMTGRTVLDQRIAPTPASIPVSADLAPGTYFVQLTTAERTLSQRIVVR
ncbi:MAG: T9SS type A sorting domain-containing protein [Flavobacteriales bacterium]|nr:T9SS type A sorting domain-containing protein [Flavobacteriales bacterium]